MSYAYARPKARKGNRTSDMRPVGAGLGSVLASIGGGKSAEQQTLFRLWEHWPMVMGPMLADLAIPLGHRGETLIVGGEDHLVLQDLAFMRDELLERVNAFMDAPRFAKVELRQVMERSRLDAVPAITPSTRLRPVPERPVNFSGSALFDTDPDSPVARCHAAYVRLHQRLNPSFKP